MWTDIFIQNKRHLLKTLNNFLKDIDDFKILIESNNIRKIFSSLKRNKKIRKVLLSFLI